MVKLNRFCERSNGEPNLRVGEGRRSRIRGEEVVMGFKQRHSIPGDLFFSFWNFGMWCF